MNPHREAAREIYPNPIGHSANCGACNKERLRVEQILRRWFPESAQPVSQPPCSNCGHPESYHGKPVCSHQVNGVFCYCAKFEAESVSVPVSQPPCSVCGLPQETLHHKPDWPERYRHNFQAESVSVPQPLENK